MVYEAETKFSLRLGLKDKKLHYKKYISSYYSFSRFLLSWKLWFMMDLRHVQAVPCLSHSGGRYKTREGSRKEKSG